MGLLLSILIVCVSVIEFLSVCSNFRRSFEPSVSNQDLSPLIRRYEEGLHKERRRILNILEQCRELENLSAENIQSDKHLVATHELSLANSDPHCTSDLNNEIPLPAPIPTISCSDICNDVNKTKRLIGKSFSTDTQVITFDSTDYWLNTPLIEKNKAKVQNHVRASKKRVKFGHSFEDERDWSRSPSPMFDIVNCNIDIGNKYETKNGPCVSNLKNAFYDVDRNVSPSLEENAWNSDKKTVSSDEDENKPFYATKFLDALDGIKGKNLPNDTSAGHHSTNAEDSWNPNKETISSDEDSGFSSSNRFLGSISCASKKKRSYRKRKGKSNSQSFEIYQNEIELSASADIQHNLTENVENNASVFDGSVDFPVVDECLDVAIAEKERNAASNAFWLIFSGEYTKAMNKDWHGQHFCCWQCDESLTGQRYVLRDEHPYCVSCYESVFANSCEKCSRTIGIDSKDLSYKDKHWHEACFLCATCGDSLVDKQFGSKGERIYCGRCYDEQFASRCDGCGQIFRAGTKKMEYKTRQWHEKCFCCNVCKTPIGTQSFIPREQEIYCAKCYEEKYATRCIKCNKVITSGGVTYKNEPWHRECFTCTHCNTSLAGARFTSRDDKPYCAECFGELFAKRCTACNKPITGIGGTKFISFEDRHWHNDCFFCASCRTSLVGRGFITDADDIICPDCAKKNLM